MMQPNRLLEFWRDHSLTIVLTAIGCAFTLLGMVAFEEGKWFDLIMGFGQGTLTVGLLYFLSYYFRETVKPEDDPDADV
jgi:hypothetical protein